MTATTLSAQLRSKNVDKEGSSSNPEGDGEGKANQSISKRKPMVFKKRKTELIVVDDDVDGLERGSRWRR